MEQKRNTATQRDHDRAESITQRDNDRAASIRETEEARRVAAAPDRNQSAIDNNRAASIRSEEYEARIAGLAESALNPIVEEVGTPQGDSSGGNDSLESASINASGGAGPEAFRIYWADGLSTVVDFSTAIANRDSDSPEDEWGIFFGISNLAHTKTITYGEGLNIYDDTGTDQTQWYLPIYGDGKLLTTGGVYRAETFCASGEPVTGLVKIG